jgi:SAM-dependent methyltransferase
MTPTSTHDSPTAANDATLGGVGLCCPMCAKRLSRTAAGVACPPCDRTDCPKAFDTHDGFLDLIIGSRFEDESSDELLAGEERNSAHTISNYWIPKFRETTAHVQGRPRILSLGCGAGMEVDALREAGFDAVGIDNGNRARVWDRRTHRDALVMANGMHLPFADGTFDIAFCGCVFPHVGVEGDSFKVTDRYYQDRLAIAKEMTRVVKPGGAIFLSSPNRWFPLDLFHGREIGTYRTPLNPPWRRFLLSRSDYARLFRDAGCKGAARAQSIKGYWGFCRTKTSVKGALLSIPVRALFALASNPVTPFLRGSALLPWIVVRVDR